MERAQHVVDQHQLQPLNLTEFANINENIPESLNVQEVQVLTTKKVRVTLPFSLAFEDIQLIASFVQNCAKELRNRDTPFGKSLNAAFNASSENLIAVWQCPEGKDPPHPSEELYKNILKNKKFVNITKEDDATSAGCLFWRVKGERIFRKLRQEQQADTIGKNQLTAGNKNLLDNVNRKETPGRMLRFGRIGGNIYFDMRFLIEILLNGKLIKNLVRHGF